MRRRFTNNQNTPFDYVNYMTIEALEDGLFVSFDSFITNTIDYCIDGQNWKKLATNENSEAINTGQRISFRGKLQSALHKGIGTFTISKKCNLNGNCMSMLFGDNAANNYSLSGKDYAFYELFRKCTNIVNVGSNFLPATILANSCYNSMFRDCTSLATAPELPATTLASTCYLSMFQNCTSLITAPALPATTLTNYCYGNMFSDCTSLATAPELPATTLATSCYINMFSNCSKLNYIKMLATNISASNCLHNWVRSVASTGTFVKNKNATWDVTGESGIPSGWTVQNA